MYIEQDQCIPFDAGLLNKVKRQIIIRIHYNNVIYTFESDLDVLRKLADGRRQKVRIRFRLRSPHFLYLAVLFHATSSSRDNYQVQR